MTESATAPDVTVIVVSWNTRDLTLACLRSVDETAVLPSLRCEVVLVDNASTDATAEAVRSEFPGTRVLALDSNVGFARAANRGMAESDGRYVLLLNSDAQLPEGALARLMTVLDEHPRSGAVGAALEGVAGERQFSCGRFLSPWNQFAETLGLSRLLPFAGLRRSYLDHELGGDVVEVDWCVGACLLLRRSAIDDVGPFDELFFMYSEDEDLCLRLRNGGWSVLHAPSVAVPHRGGASAARALDRMRNEARDSQNAFVRKHFGAFQAACFRALMTVARLKPRRSDSHVGWGR